MTKFRVKDWDRDTFPALYRSADEASLNAQWWYVRWVAFNLGVLVLGAFVGSLSFGTGLQKQAIQIAAAACFFLALGTTLLLAFRRWEKTWFAGRAVAESVCSLTWKFVTRAAPYSIDVTECDAVELFTKSLGELLDENKSLAAAITGSDSGGDQVTSTMRKWRTAPVAVLRDLYVSQRVNDQQAWYTGKAKTNKRHQNCWFGILIACQALAGFAAITLAVNPDFPWKAAAVFSTLASAAIAWGQVKRFQELSQAYGYAAQELSLISARALDVSTEEGLARFVNDAETAISREHSSWVARRETR